MTAKNFTGGLTLNTPEFFARQQGVAANAVGIHLLIAAKYNGGVAIGHKFNKNQNDPREWIERINSTSLVVGWGDWGHFRQLCSFIRELILGIKDLITEEYVTNSFLIDRAALLLESASQSSQPYGVALVFIDLGEEKLSILHFNGKIMRRSQFGVLGGYDYEDLKRLKEESKIVLAKHGIKPGGLAYDPPPEVIQELDDVYVRSIKTPLKSALVTLEKIYGERDLLDTKEEAIGAVKNTLLKHDPPSKKETFEITTFENGNFESIYFTRRKQKMLACNPSRK